MGREIDGAWVPMRIGCELKIAKRSRNVSTPCVVTGKGLPRAESTHRVSQP